MIITNRILAVTTVSIRRFLTVNTLSHFKVNCFSNVKLSRVTPYIRNLVYRKLTHMYKSLPQTNLLEKRIKVVLRDFESDFLRRRRFLLLSLGRRHLSCIFSPSNDQMTSPEISLQNEPVFFQSFNQPVKSSRGIVMSKPQHESWQGICTIHMILLGRVFDSKHDLGM